MSPGPKPTDTVSNWCDNGQEFEDLLDLAEAGIETDSDEEFCSSIRARWDDYGMRAYLSMAAWERLKQLAGEAT